MVFAFVSPKYHVITIRNDLLPENQRSHFIILL
jgi:hypothetical protein